MNEIIDKDKSSYFDFKKSTNSDAFNFSMHTGWSGLVVIKFKLEKDQDLTSDFIRLKFSEIYNKEKILVVVKGILKISLKKKYFLLKEFDALNFYQEASILSRLGSGSASRSIYGGLVVWGGTPTLENANDEYAIEYPHIIDPIFKNYCDGVLLL